MDDTRRGQPRASDTLPRGPGAEALDPRPGAYGDVLRPTGRIDAATADDPPRQRVTGEREEAPSLRAAVLGRLEGLGLITVVRAHDGAVVDALGTWRPADDTASIDDLRTTFPAGSVTTYTGSLVESRGDSPLHDVNLQVEITRHGEYEDHDGRAVRLVNFVARDAV
jgi:hypothetical protein